MPASLKFSNEERELLDTIHDAPHDVGPYLAYADWLEERGHPMGEFIRLRLAIEKRHVEKPAQQCEVMRKRANDLLSTHGKDWSRPVSREFEYRGHTINGMPYAQDQPFEDFERADGWLRRMSPRLFLGIHLSSCGDELASQLRHPFLRRVHGVRFYLPNYLFRPNQNDGGYRMIADADVLKRCFSVSLSVGTFSDLTDDTWALLAERFKDVGSYDVESYAGDMPSSEFVGRYQPYDPYAIVSTTYRFSNTHPSSLPTWVREYRKLTDEELNSPDCRERRKRAGIFVRE